MEKARIPVKILREGARLPQYGSAFAAGADLYACLEKELTIEPGKSALVPTGVALEAAALHGGAGLCPVGVGHEKRSGTGQ